MFETLKTTARTIGPNLAGEAKKPDELIFVRVELDDLDQDNYGITVEGNTLQLDGAKVCGWATRAENQPATT